MTMLPTGLRPRLPIHRRPLSSGVYSLFSRTHALSHERATITTPPCSSSSTLDRTRVPQENISETGEISEDCWLPPNHRPKTKKGIATAKRLWDKYVLHACYLCLQRGVSVRTANGMLSGIVSILMSMLIRTFWKASITTLNQS